MERFKLDLNGLEQHSNVYWMRTAEIKDRKKERKKKKKKGSFWTKNEKSLFSGVTFMFCVENFNPGLVVVFVVVVTEVG